MVTDLTCEYRKEPLGIDVQKPRLSWILSGERPGLRQVAYEISAGGFPGSSSFWTSERLESDRSVSIPYEGMPVSSGTRVYWRVQAWDELGEVHTSDDSWFEMGLLLAEDWQGKWIQSSLAGGPRSGIPAPYLRTDFIAKPGLMRARLYVAALGLYETFLNGEHVGDIELAPGWTDFGKRLRYQTYDVTEHLRQGINCLGVILGDGWYCGHVEWRDRQMYGDRPKLLAQLVMSYEDGPSEVVLTDGTWKTAFGSILSNDIMMGEAHDARREPHGWSTAGFDDSHWHPVEVAEVSPNLVAQNDPPMKCFEEIRPVAIIEKPQWPGSKWIFDLGQNMVGRIRLKASGEAGTTLAIRYAERLDEKGAMYTANYRSARSTDYFTFAGAGEEIFEPKFTFHGFQYVELFGLSSPPDFDMLTGIVIHSEWPRTGEFECSNPLLNQLQHNILWGWKGNSLDVPTDCPQRDERLGWTGDAQVFVRTAAFNAGVAPFFEKYQQDLEDSQSDTGQIPPTAPNTGVVGRDGGPAWADAFAICPWAIYRCFGDKELLDKHFEAVRRWVDSLDLNSRDLIRSYPGYTGFLGFGDWLSTNAETPIDLIGTAFYAYSARLLSEMAKVLDRHDDAKKYADLSQSVKQAFQKRYVTEGGLIASGSQTAYVLALHFNLLPEELRGPAVQNLVDDIGRRGYHLSTGFVGTPYINHVLSEGGRLDVAYRLLLQESWPSWLYSVTQGATTIWERWDGWTQDKGFQDPGMNSFNHYAYGAIGDWLYSIVAGIDLDPDVPAYKRSVLKPRPGGGLTYARASLKTLYGNLSSNWRIEEETFRWKVEIPANTTAIAEFPPETSEWSTGSRTVHLEPGNHEFQAHWTPVT